MKIGYYLLINPEMDNKPMIKELQRAGAEKLYGDLENDEGFYPNRKKLLNEIKEGDCLILKELCHFIDTPKHFFFLAKYFQEKFISLISLKEELDSENYKTTLETIITVYEFNSKILSKNSIKGLKTAKEFGITGGRKPGLSKSAKIKAKAAARLYLQGIPNHEILTATLIPSLSTLYRYLKHEGITPQKPIKTMNFNTEISPVLDVNNSSNEIATKRKRGRPRKTTSSINYPLESFQSDISKFPTNENASVRRRGRPKKNM